MLSSWNAVLQLRETWDVLGLNGADEPDPIVDSVECRSANMGRALGPSKDGPRSTWTGHDPSMEFPASHSTLVWEGQTAEKDGDAFFHLSYEWTAGHWNGLISHQSHSNISEIKRFLAGLKKRRVSFHWYPPISVPKRKSVVPVLVKMSPYINCNETNNVSVTQVEHCQPKWVNRQLWLLQTVVCVMRALA